ncbi:MAG: CotH kinase family protein, partial [Clostridia bacterium]|nr:CotH kinase family protein [Clostridia bacterium]
ELNGIYSEYENTYTDENGGSAAIHIRGNSSAASEPKSKNKYSYKLKLDTKADLFGFGESKHWYLINNWFDVSALRNKLAYDFSGALGLPYTQSTWVELYYNGEYRGLYLLTESIRIEDGRIETINWDEFGEDVAKAYAADNSLSEADRNKLILALQKNLSWITTGSIDLYIFGDTNTIDLTPYFDPEAVDITSGYLVEYDGRLDGDRTKWSTANNVPVALKNPEKLATNPEMYDYLKTLIADFEEALFSPTFHNSKGKHYSEYLDVQSLVDYWLVWTIFDNQEFGYLSMFYYVDGGKIHFGPCWDFDFASGNIVTLFKNSLGPERWTTDRRKAWYKEIMGDPYFSVLCQERWFEIKELTDDLVRSLDIYRTYIEDAATRCYERNGPRRNWYVDNINNRQSYDFQGDFENLKNWFGLRFAWLDEQFKRPDAQIDASTNTRHEKLIASAALNDLPLKYNLVDPYGVQADYVISPDSKGELDILLASSHTTAVSCALYLNGTELIGESPISQSSRAQFVFDVSKLDLTEGAINVLYLPTFRSDGTMRSMTSMLIRVSSYAEKSVAGRTIKCGDTVYTVPRGESFTFPEITAEREGFIPEGWTDGEDLYLPGESVKLTESFSFYIRYKRVEIFSAMDMAK